ncbi:MAG TPA: AMP-binding protein, partial [Dehalococcoidia bacterium]|nr:AMP-binding protein [Dehalococcoidia bacterium]
MNTSEFLTIAAAIVPERTAIIFEGQRFSFAQLQERANRLANALAGLGVAAGDRVAVMQVNCHQAIEAYFAAARLDAVYVPLNFRAKADELAQMLDIAQPAVLLVGERYLPLAPVAGQEGALPAERVIVLDAPGSGGRLGY